MTIVDKDLENGPLSEQSLSETEREKRQKAMESVLEGITFGTNAEEEEDPKAYTKKDISIEEGSTKQPIRRPQASDTVLDLDRWSKRKGGTLAQQWDNLDDEEWEGLDDCTSVAADAYGSVFEPQPRLSENPSNEHRAEWWKQLLDTPEYQSLHNQTCLDTALSEIAAKSIYDQWEKYCAQCPPPDPEQGQPAPGSEEEAIGDSIQRIRSAAKAVSQAGQSVQEAKDAAAGLGLGTDQHPLDPKELHKYYDLVRNNDQLRRIMQVAGRMRALCQALQRNKTTHGRDDMVGVELGGDIERLVPSELAQLASGIDELEIVALDRVTRRQALCRQYRGTERVGKGPIVVCVDESSSMNGEKIIAAKALALAMAWLARQQKRWIALVGFSKGPTGTCVSFSPGGPLVGIHRDNLIEWLMHFFNGGTTLDVPLKTVPLSYWPNFKDNGMPSGKTDMIIITDAQVSCSNEMQSFYLDWAKQEQAKTYGIIVGQREAGDLQYVCDRYWCIPSLDLDSEAVEGVLSI